MTFVGTKTTDSIRIRNRKLGERGPPTLTKPESQHLKHECPNAKKLKTETPKPKRNANRQLILCHCSI